MVFFVRFGFIATNSGPDNLDSLNSITSLVWTLYIKTKQEANKVGRPREKIATSGNFTLNNITLPTAHLINILNETCNLYGLEFLGKETTPQLRGNFQANLTLFYAFKSSDVKKGYTLTTPIVEVKLKKKEISHRSNAGELSVHIGHSCTELISHHQ